MKALYIFSIGLLSLNLTSFAQDARNQGNAAGVVPPPAMGPGAAIPPERYGMPSPMHKILENMEGVWKETAMIYDAAGSKPVMIEEQVYNLMVMDGLFLQSTHTAMVNGRPFKAVSTTGFDNARNIFMNTWLDNMSSGMIYSEGILNPEKSIITFQGTMVVAGSRKSVPFRQEVLFADKENLTIRTYMIPGDKEYMSMEIKMQRDNSTMPANIQDARQRHMIMQQIMQKQAAADRRPDGQ